MCWKFSRTSDASSTPPTSTTRTALRVSCFTYAYWCIAIFRMTAAWWAARVQLNKRPFTIRRRDFLEFRGSVLIFSPDFFVLDH